MYNGPKVLDLTEKLLNKTIRDAILEMDGLSPEEQFILLEEYHEKYKCTVTFDMVRRQ